MKNPAQQYKAWHWGISHKREIHWPDPLYPKGTLLECGRLCELHVKNAKTQVIQVGDPSKETWPDDPVVDGSHVAYDPNHPKQRLYVLSHPALKRAVKQRFWDDDAATYLLADVAEAIGGHHGTRDYPRVMVQPLGILKKLGYFSEKGDDGESIYVHQMGEHGGISPVLCIDECGRFWIAGGSYTVPVPGITR